jgi:hypothetical protein
MYAIAQTAPDHAANLVLRTRAPVPELFSRCPPQTQTARRIPVPLINLVVILIVIGVLLWLVNTYIPMDRKIKNILNLVVVIAVVIWLLQVFGVLGSLDNIRIGN